MFCKNCGNEMAEVADICVKCGCAKGNGNNYCQNCGNQVTAGAEFCTSCGVKMAPAIIPGQQKSKIAAGLLAIFLGSVGVHNFYLGYTGKAVAQLLISLLTCGFGAPIVAIWALIEGIMIFTGSISVDAKGIALKD